MYALFRQALLNYDPDPDISRPGPEFLLGADGDWRLYYAPLEYVNPFASLIVVGATPGFGPWRASVLAARNALREGRPDGAALLASQRFGVCTLEQRQAVCALLDACGLNRHLGLESCARLFERSESSVDWATPLDGVLTLRDQPYSGAPDYKSPFLSARLEAALGTRLDLLSHAPIAAFGPSASAAVRALSTLGRIAPDRPVLELPAPSDPLSVADALARPETLPHIE